MSTKPVYETIKEYLVDLADCSALNKIPLPSEKQLCIKFGVSRVSVRRAFSELEKQFKIERYKGKGSFFIRPERADAVGESPRALFSVIIPDYSKFSRDILFGINDFCKNNNADYFVSFTFSASVLEERHIVMAKKMKCKGIILMPTANGDYNDELVSLALSEFPLVLIDRKLLRFNLPCVSSNHREIGETAAKILFEKGHSNIVFFSSKNTVSSVLDRINGFGRIAALNRIKGYYEDISDVGDYYEYFKRYVQSNRKITGFAVPAYAASQLLKILNTVNGSDSGQYDVVIIDDEYYNPSDLVNKKCSVIVQDGKQIGYKAMEMLYNKVFSGT
ncbi:MAG: GntR family transcriptional regulator, partial [Christensenellales bacterium]